MTKKITILGSTGSIGLSTLKVVDAVNCDLETPTIEIEALVAGRNVELLVEQAKRYRPNTVVIFDESKLPIVEGALKGTGTECLSGHQAVKDVSERPVDIVMAAIVGSQGLGSVMAALESGNDVALANKETMVCAGPLVKATAARTGAKIVPVDSEHNAMFQVLQNRERVEKFILTASGGPFLNASFDDMRNAAPKSALNHPRWSMGAKNSLDSATMMNKGLEIIETAYLFDAAPGQIDVLIHPQSIIHGMVSYTDGSFLAQLGETDMQIPIAHALGWPDRLQTQVKRLDLTEICTLEFFKPDHERFPAIRLALAAAGEGPVATGVFNAANEVAGEHFLEGRCRFTDISRVVEETLEIATQQLQGLNGDLSTSLDAVLHVDTVARKIAADKLAHLS